MPPHEQQQQHDIDFPDSDEHAMNAHMGEPEKVPISQTRTNPNTLTNNWFTRMFFTKKFRTHRLMGLFYLIQYVLALGLYVFDYERFTQSHLVWMVPVTGVIQSITAIYTFTFLPRKADPGITYLSDKSALSYFFIIENSFFEMLLMFQWLYYSDYFYQIFRQTIIIEVVFVFLPYMFRPLWPKTRLRDAMKNEKNKTDKNRKFMLASNYVIKVFYIFAKHYIGYFLNYVRFLDRISPSEQYLVFGLMITSSFATTISIFLHTLKFKGYIGPRTATIVYEASYLLTGYYFLMMFTVFVRSPDVAILTFIGLLINFGSWKLQQAWQIVMLGLLYSTRMGHIDLSTLTLF